HTAIVECERAVFDDELIRDEFLACSLVPRDQAGDGLAAVVAITDPDADVIANPESLATPSVVEFDLDRAHGDEFACLPCPRKMALSVPAETAGEDSLECGALLARCTSVHVQNPRPR